MALGDSYATLTEFKNSINLTSTETDTQITDSLAAASREIERHCGRQFNKVTVPSTRFYETHNPWTVVVDDFYTTTDLEIAVGNTTLTADQYRLETPSLSAAGDPYYRIRARGGFNFPTYYGADVVEVTAAWGWAAVPVEVKQSCLVLANENLKLVREFAFGVTGTNSAGFTVYARDNQRVAKWLAPYRRLDGVVA